MCIGQMKNLGAFFALGLVLAACQDIAPSGGQGQFQRNYTAARDALESGKYERANRLYPKLIETAGPLKSRLSLEFAHSLLRSERYVEAAQQAQMVARQEQGAARAAALSVYGTAQHELGLAALQTGDTENGKRYLQAASNAMTEVLASHPELDPIGALTGRKASIQIRLKSLG